MKRIILPLLLVCCLLLCACARSADNETGAAALAEHIRENLSARGVLISADDDFYLLNFSDAPAPAERAVYSSGTAPTTEFGVFRMENEKDAAEMERAVRSYLETEKESRASLARLYPTEDADEDFSRFENALCGRNGKTVYYFVGDSENAARAKEILNL